MSIVTARATLTINAAFLQEIKDDNQRLRDLFSQARKLMEEADDPPKFVTQFSRVLSELRDQLAMHFALEEAYGYFDEAVHEAPRLSTQAEALRGQHKVLFEEICGIAEQAERLCYRRKVERMPARLLAQFRAFDERLRNHEQQENELILAAFDDDIGTGD